MKSLEIFPTTWRALILLSSDPHAVLEKMKVRANGIDLLDINYVKMQDLVFECFAAEFDLPTLKINVEKPQVMINTISAFVHHMRGSCVLLTSPHTTLKILHKNAGIDLKSAATYNLKKGVPQKIKLKEICLIPLGYCGMLFPRSSWHTRIHLQTGIIDAGYAETLSTTVIPLVDCVVESGERFCQIVVVNIPERRCMEFDRDAVQSRGGYGSTGRF
uniref:SPBc2 prophage-derived deoxyuridine 5'-triphosphate nucleotidohydrolase YosS n=1 Tax=Anoplophora glabripennis TaxID=217634 RepID=V5GK79_ANOGL